MKKIYLTIVLMLVVVASHAQDYTINGTFASRDGKPSDQLIIRKGGTEVTFQNAWFAGIYMLNDGKVLKASWNNTKKCYAIYGIGQIILGPTRASNGAVKTDDISYNIFIYMIPNELKKIRVDVEEIISFKIRSRDRIITGNSTNLFSYIMEGGADPKDQPKIELAKLTEEQIELYSILIARMYKPLFQSLEIDPKRLAGYDFKYDLKMSGTPLEWANSFSITDVLFETLTVDVDKFGGNRRFSGPADFAEYFAKLELNIFTANNLQTNLGFIVKGTQPTGGYRANYLYLRLKEKVESIENYTKTFSLSKTDFSNASIRFYGSLIEFNPYASPESNHFYSENDNVMLNQTSFKEVTFKNLFIGKNYFDIQKGKDTLRIHFTITPN
jgi:hypothetical protein